MRYRRAHIRRPGAALLEHALILPILILIVLGMIAGGLGVFRYQQMVTLAREGARYAAVRGAEYGTQPGKAAATPADVYNNAILPLAAGLDPAALSYSVTWPNGKYAVYADATSNPPGQPKGATVVTVSYNWIPEAVFGGVTLSSTSVMPMQY
jgi:Flp pilus assembly protein TadG